MLLEMIPKEYWRLLYSELQAVNWITYNATDTPQERTQRIAQEYDNAIEQRRINGNRIAARKVRERKKALSAGAPQTPATTPKGKHQ